MSCRNHPQVAEGLEHCYRCGYRFCNECVVSFQGHMHCAGCKNEAVGMLETGQPERLDSGEGQLPPWERRAEIGFVAGFVETVKGVMLEPTTFFRRMDKTAKTFDCLVPPIIIQIMVAIVGAILQLTILGGMAGFMGGELEELAPMLGGNAVGAIAGVVFAPIGAVIGIFLYAGAMHLWLHMTSNTSAPFHQTMRGYCYSSSPNIVGIIPFIGGIVGGIWALVTTVIMLKETHKTTTGHAVMAALWLVLLFMCLGIGVVALVIAANQ